MLAGSAGRQPQGRAGLVVVARAGMPPAPTAAALPVGFPCPAVKSAGSSASPTAADVGTYAWIKESNIMSPVFETRVVPSVKTLMDTILSLVSSIC